MGTVYRAVRTGMDRAVAIKLLHPELCGDRGVINRFFHEARAANTVHHPHVIEVFDFVDSGPDVYFVMELLQGEDLHDAIYRVPEPMPLARAAGILEQIAAALDATHAHNIVHRDLKPENVFLGDEDFVKVFDFGICKLSRLDGKATVQGTMLGTPEYMAPEQVRGDAVDARADIYALGCIAYELLTRRQAFAGGTQAQVLVRQISGAVTPPRALIPTVPQAVEDVVLWALAKEPDARPQTVRAFAERLVRAVGRPLDTALFGERSALSLISARPAAAALRSRIRRAARSRYAKPTLAMALGAAILAVAGPMGRSGRAREEAPPRPAIAEGQSRTTAATPAVHPPWAAHAFAAPAFTSSIYAETPDPSPASDRPAPQRAREEPPVVAPPNLTIDPFRDGNPERVPKPSRDGLRQAEPGFVHAITGSDR
jgi:serine/threonine-protein kinase